MAQRLAPPNIKSLLTVASTTVTATSSAFTIPIADSYTFYMNVSTAQTTCDTVFLTSVDGGTTYVNVPWRFAQVTTTTGCFVLNVVSGQGPGNDVTAPTGTGTLIADTGGALNLRAVVDPNFMKFKYTLSGTTAFTLYCASWPRGTQSNAE